MQVCDSPVLDKTGLIGTLNFGLVITPEFNSRNESDPGYIHAFMIP
jgi:hypothetical protein